MRARFAIAASVIILATAIITAGGPGEQYAAKPANDVPTFSKDVAPILYKNCATCHRPGEIAPMSLLTYAEARPWAKSIRDEVSDGTMPPWHADPKHGKFANDRSLTAADRDVLTRWANGGAPEGDAKDLPAAPKFVDGWQLGQPDTVLQLPVEYKYRRTGSSNTSTSNCPPTSRKTSGWKGSKCGLGTVPSFITSSCRCAPRRQSAGRPGSAARREWRSLQGSPAAGRSQKEPQNARAA